MRRALVALLFVEMPCACTRTVTEGPGPSPGRDPGQTPEKDPKPIQLREVSLVVRK